MSDYTLTQSQDQETEQRRLALIQAYQDPSTIRYLKGVGVGEGWRCLDVGAGAGSIAHWLASHVGASGSVVATDLETDLLELLDAPNLEVRRHDIRHDDLPERYFDLIHARLVLLHLPERDAVLFKLVAATCPGGWLVISDCDLSTIRLAHHDPVFERVTEAFEVAVRHAGWDPVLGPTLPAMLERHGVTDVEAESWQSYQRGSSPAPSILSLTYERLRSRLLDRGITPGELDHVQVLLDDPSIGVYGPTLWAAWGRRPTND
ncbi:MAG: methyltransferase [Pseudonocardiaceae bacterium]